VSFLAVELLMWLAEVRPPGVSGFDSVETSFATRTGQIALARIVLAALAFMMLAGVGHGRLAAVLALLAAVLGGATGHSASVTPAVAVPINALHLGAVSIWLGGLVLLVLCPAVPTSRSASWRYRDVVRSVSSAALLAVVLVLVTGLVETFLYLPDLASLFGSAYGRLILLKAAGLVVLAGVGAYHRFRILPAQEADALAGGRAVRRTVRLEALLMVLRIVLAALLARISLPAGKEPRGTADRRSAPAGHSALAWDRMSPRGRHPSSFRTAPLASP
jgi:copper transport protein